MKGLIFIYESSNSQYTRIFILIRCISCSLPALEEQKAALPHTSRMTDIPYDKARSYVVTLDGFIISDTIECLAYDTIITDYSYSDHEPVRLQFYLKETES